MKKIFALLALIAFIGVVSTPATANVTDNFDKTVQVVMDDDNSVIADQDPVKKKKTKKTATKVTKSTAKGCGGCASKAGCEEAKKEECGSSCEGEKKAETKKETKKKSR